MACHALDEVLRVEALVNHFVKEKKYRIDVVGKDILDHAEIVFVIEHVEIGYDILISDVVARKTHHLVENRESVTKCAVGFLCDDVESLLLGRHAFFCSDILQMFGDIFNRNAFKIKYLASRQDSRKDFMLLCGGKDKLSIRWRLFEGLQKRVERRARQHVNLVYDIHLVLTDLRRNTNLVDEGADVVNTAV